jgi:hypothetical protein
MNNWDRRICDVTPVVANLVVRPVTARITRVAE